MTILDFINGCKNKSDITYFDDPIDAYNYGKKVRETIEKQNFDDKIIVDFYATTTHNTNVVVNLYYNDNVYFSHPTL
jgi:hypothetical protein